MSRALLALVFAALLATACDSGNPVAPAPPGSTTDPSASVAVTVTASSGQIEAGAAAAVTLSVSALQGSGAPVADGTTASVSTSLGNFGVDATGTPVQLATLQLRGGKGSLALYAGDKTGTANILAQVGTSVGKLNLPIVEPSPRPVADFTFSVNELTVLFTDASTGDPTAWSWSFGDTQTTTQQNPMHTYAAPGTYTVTLTASSSGGSNTKSQFVTVGDAPALAAAFEAQANGLTVLFTDASIGDPTSWAWDFGDGRTSGAQSPSHTYARAGTYTVGLTITNQYGTRASTSQFVTVSLGDPPAADFAVETQGLRALFTDASKPTPTAWFWDFGDGGTSLTQNPSHLYAAEGTYRVTLTATNAGGSASKTQFVTVSLGDPPVADFKAQTNGLQAVFQDKSTGRPTSWSWDFGECAGAASCTSTQQNPTYTYAQPGTYTVTLTASNAAGSSQAIQLVTVASAAPPVASFCYKRNGASVIFSDTSTQSPTSWAWDFGDCATTPATCQSTAQNPGHSYVLGDATEATFVVTLTAKNATGQSTRSVFVNISTTTVDAFAICD